MANKFALQSLVVLLSAIGLQAGAVDLMTTARETFYEPGHNIRTGVEMEFTGLSVPRVTQIVEWIAQGKAVTKTEDVKTTVKHVDEKGNKVYNTISLTEYEIISPLFGKITIKPDLNQRSDFDRQANINDAVIEIVTSPLHEAQVFKFQEIATALKNAGAIGTTEKNAVSLQFNNEQSDGNMATMDWRAVLNRIRNEFDPTHLKMINASRKVPEIRKIYVQSMTLKTVEKLSNPHYNPTARNLFDDIIYRQSLQLLGFSNAWEMTIAQAHKLLLEQKNPIVPRVVKQTRLRTSSLLMAAFPDDPMSKLYLESGWAKPAPILEERQPNNNFDVITPYKETIGMQQAAKKYGFFDHDSLISSLSGVDMKSIKNLRKRSSENESTQKLYIYRYFLGNAKKVEQGLFRDMTKAYDNTIVGFIPFGTLGAKPLYLPGESLVFHRIPLHRFSVMGKYNPTLVNYNIGQVLENKFTEAKFWTEYSPGSMPETELLAHLSQNGDSPQAVVNTLNARFPNGWVLKGVWDLGTENFLVTSKMNLADLIEKYRASDFDSYKNKAEERAQKLGYAPETVLDELKVHPQFMGWKVNQLLTNVSLTIAQNAVNINREFRVEVIAGHVLGHGSTQDRYYYKYKYGIDGRQQKDYVVPDISVFAQVEAFAQSVMDKLPPELHDMTFGMDIAWLADGSFTMIESNPGGNSSFLFEEEAPSVRALRQALDAFPARVKAGEINLGLSGSDQMKFIDGHFKKWGIDTASMYPGMNFLDDQIYDAAYQFQVVNSKNSSYGHMKCSEVLLPSFLAH
jgi:hypothetical protein